MGRRIDYLDDPDAPKANSLVPSVNVGVMNERGEVLLIRRTDNENWAMPGGAMDIGETIAEAAVRETREETGLEVEIERRLSSIRYFFVRGSTRFNKSVHFFLMRAVGGSPDDHDAEFDEVRWVDVPEALALLTHATERTVVEEAAAALRRPPGPEALTAGVQA
jgi:ADP-ribose pyrophosphatase YjhB (NUDIX family)